MGRPNPQTQGKRQREQLKKDRRREKDAKRAARKAAKAATNASAAGTNPQATVVGGPVPVSVPVVGLQRPLFRSLGSGGNKG